MKDKIIWLIRFKAKIEEHSQMNMDGSDFAHAIGVVFAKTLAQAVVELDLFMSRQQLALIDIYGCETYEENCYSDDSDKSEEIKAAIDELLRREVNATIACAVTSGCMKILESDI